MKLVLFLMIIGIGCLWYYAGMPEIYVAVEKPIEEVDYPSDCSNLSLVNTTDCLRNFIETFFNYTIRSDIERSVEDVINNGGDCHDWSLFLQRIYLSLNFNAETFSIFPDEGSGHEFLIVWDKNLTEYCVVDMLNNQCWEFEKGNEIPLNTSQNDSERLFIKKEGILWQKNITENII